MDEVIAEFARSSGVDKTVARKAMSIIVAFVSREAKPKDVEALFAKLPGARELAAEHGPVSGGLLGLFNELVAAGLGMGDLQSLANAFLGHARTKAGDAEVNAVVRGIPGLAQFI